MESVLRTFYIPRSVNWWTIWISILGVLSGLLLLLLGLILFVDFDTPPDYVLFLGRFHPSLVHFPIGVLFLAVLLEGSAYFYTLKTLRLATSFVLTVGASSAVMAMGAGYVLSLSGGYESELVGWHKWAGILATGGAILASVLNLLYLSRRSKRIQIMYRLVLFVTVGVLLYAGHLGGTLTHGSGYLTEYMPAPLKTIVGGMDQPDKDRGFPVVEEAEIYGDLVKPILKKHCVECHGRSKSKGDLRLDSKEEIQKGGEHGKVLVSGQPEKSELYRRVTLPPHDEDVMPPEDRKPLGVGDTELIRFWIKNGVSFDQKVKDVQDKPVPSSVRTVLDRLSKPAAERKTGIFALDVGKPNTGQVEKIRNSGIRVQFVSDEKRFLQVDFSVDANAQPEPIDKERLRLLKPVFEQVAWLNFEGAKIQDGALEVLSAMKHLSRLNLRNTGVKSEDLQAISSLKHLKFINLVGTDVDDSVVAHLKELPALRSLYLWRTNVSKSALEKLEQQKTHLTINTGAKLEEAPGPELIKDDSDESDDGD